MRLFDLQSHSYERHAWACHAYSLMPSHYHLLLETTQRTLSKRMKHLNGKYTGQFNHCHGRERHGLGDGLKLAQVQVILLDRDTYWLG